jgi:hypothetical protein
MLEDRNIKYPSYVLALLLAVVAYVDITHALALKDLPNGSAGWVVELLTCAISAVIATLLLTRPHLWFFAAALVWSLFAFLANFVMKSKGGDPVATDRMTLYFIILVAAAVMTGIEGWKWYLAEKAKRPVNPWAGGGWPGQYPGAPMPGPGGQWGQPSYAPQQPPPPPPPMQPAPPPPPAPPAP